MTLKTKNPSLERMKQAKQHSIIFFPNKFNSFPAPKKGINLNFKNKNKIKIAQKPSHYKFKPPPLAINTEMICTHEAQEGGKNRNFGDSVPWQDPNTSTNSMLSAYNTEEQ